MRTATEPCHATPLHVACRALQVACRALHGACTGRRALLRLSDATTSPKPCRRAGIGMAARARGPVCAGACARMPLLCGDGGEREGHGLSPVPVHMWRAASPESGQVEISVLQRCVRKAPIRRQSALLLGLRLAIRECRTAPPQTAVRHEPTAARRRARMRGFGCN